MIDFLERLKRELLQVKGGDDIIWVSEFMQSIQAPSIIGKLNARVLVTGNEMVEKVKRFIDVKEAFNQLGELGFISFHRYGGG